MTVSLGPIGRIIPDVPANPRADGFGANPRCLRRDVNRHASSVLYANYTYNLIKEADTIDLFQKNMLGMPEKNDWGVHMAGHYTIGGDPGGVSIAHLMPHTCSFPKPVFRLFVLYLLTSTTGLLLLARRPNLLVSSRDGGSHLVDLADARP
jgi:hypothetical protein